MTQLLSAINQLWWTHSQNPPPSAQLIHNMIIIICHTLGWTASFICDMYHIIWSTKTIRFYICFFSNMILHWLGLLVKTIRLQLTYELLDTLHCVIFITAVMVHVWVKCGAQIVSMPPPSFQNNMIKIST